LTAPTNNKISEEDLKTLNELKDKWLESQQIERFNFGELCGFKNGLYIKYNVSPDEYFIDGFAGEIRKRNRDLRVRKD
jgi:hypothetical protein